MRTAGSVVEKVRINQSIPTLFASPPQIAYWLSVTVCACGLDVCWHLSHLSQLCWGTIDGQLVDISAVDVTKLLCELLLANPTLPPPKLFSLCAVVCMWTAVDVRAIEKNASSSVNLCPSPVCGFFWLCRSFGQTAFQCRVGGDTLLCVFPEEQEGDASHVLPFPSLVLLWAARILWKLGVFTVARHWLR